MRHLPIVIASACVAGLACPARAQLPACSGTVTRTADGNDYQARLTWLPPDTLKVELPADPWTGAPARVVLASGKSTTLWEPATRRLRVWKFNAAREWWRGWQLENGGPANLWLAGPANEETAKVFNTAGTTPGTWTLRDATLGLRSVRDTVLFGGGGDKSYYASYKTWVRDFPDTLNLDEGQFPLSRKEITSGKTTLDATLEKAPDTRFPGVVSVMAGGRKLQFRYDLKPLDDKPAPLSLPAEAGQAIREDEPLGPTAAYPGGDASSLWNQGAAWAVASEDYQAAFDYWGRAAREAPTATAPALASFELALAARDLKKAEQFLQLLGTLKLDAVELAVRRARLAIFRREYAEARDTLKIAAVAAPENVTLGLLLADVQRTVGDVAGARATLLALLRLPGGVREGQAAVAELLARIADTTPGTGTLETLTGDAPQIKLARGLLLLGTDKTPDTVNFANESLQVSLAFAFERAGREDDARLAWTSLEANGSTANRQLARAHLVSLSAARGDVNAALRFWRDILAGATSETERQNAHRHFLGAWQKAFRMDTLKASLQNRSMATGATTDDLRLWLTYQDTYGTPDEANTIVEVGAARFPAEPFWLSRRAELLVEKAAQQRGTPAGIAQRDKLYNEALEHLTAAIKADPKQPYYAMQKALVATRRAAVGKLVVDAGRASAFRNAAVKEVDRLLEVWGNDTDARLCASFCFTSIGGEVAGRALLLAAEAVGGDPQDGDRHELVSAARQQLAAFGRTLRKPQQASEEYDALLEAARTPEEQAGLASSYIKLLGLSAGDTPIITGDLLIKIAGEPWPHAPAQLMMDTLSSQVAATENLALPTLTYLSREEGPHARVAEAALAAAIYARANAAASVDGAPAAAERALALATQNANAAYGRLTPVLTGPDRIAAARALGLMAQTQEGDKALPLFLAALKLEPREPAFHLSVIDALQASGKTAEARAARDTALTTLAAAPETFRRLGLSSVRMGDGALAWKLASEAFLMAQFSPDFQEVSFQRLGFAAARAAFAAGQVQRGAELFNGLALPQWDKIDRAAALADLALAYQLANRPEDAARVAPRLAALALTPDELTQAQNFLDTIDE